MTDPDRISKLIALMGIAFCWAHLTGEWLHHQKPIKLKKHGRKEISVFRYGFDHLREILLNIMDEKRDRQYILNQVRDTIDLPAAA